MQAGKRRGRLARRHLRESGDALPAARSELELGFEARTPVGMGQQGYQLRIAALLEARRQ
jgi:hypothetical protein